MLITLLFNVLISNALTFRREKSILYSRIVMITLLLSAYIALNNLFVISLDKGVSIYGGLFHITAYTQLFNIFILIISAIILILTSFYPRKVKEIRSNKENPNKGFGIILSSKLISEYSKIVSGKNGESFKIIEYPLIILFVILGALFLMSSSDLISVFLSIELQSYGLYILSTIYRNSEKSTGAGLTYFLLGGLSSCFILLGSSLLYVNSGTTNLEGIYLLNSLSEVTSGNFTDIINSKLNDFYTFNLWYKPNYIHLSLILIGVGFLFKVSAAPFHFWSPDVYDAIPTIVTTFVAIIAKISIFIFLLELVYYTSNNNGDIFTWTNILVISSLASLIIGSLLGLVQTRIKRLYAYSTISHVGFILLGLSVNSVESIQAYIFYIITYTLSNLNAFFILLAIGYTLYCYINKYEDHINNDYTNNDKAYSPISLISELKGYYYINPFLAISLSITLFSFVGVPPLFGFFAKQMILSAALDSGYYFMTLVAILTSVIGAVYYLSLIKQIFFFKSDYVINFGNKKNYNRDHMYGNVNEASRIDVRWSISSALSLTISFLTLLLLLFIFIPNEWLNVANILTLLLFKT